MTDYNESEELSEALADFDAFLDETDEPQPTGQPFRMYGRTYRLPTSMPLIFTLEVQRLRHSSRPEDIRTLLAALFGPDAIGHWAANCMSDRRLGIVLKWATANMAKPGSMSMQEAADLHDAEEAKEAAEKATAGKEPTPRPAKARTKATPKKKATPRSSGAR